MESSNGRERHLGQPANQPVSTVVSLKKEQAAFKRRVTNILKKLESAIEQYGRKALIYGMSRI